MPAGGCRKTINSFRSPTASSRMLKELRFPRTKLANAEQEGAPVSSRISGRLAAARVAAAIALETVRERRRARRIGSDRSGSIVACGGGMSYNTRVDTRIGEEERRSRTSPPGSGGPKGKPVDEARRGETRGEAQPPARPRLFPVPQFE